MKVLSYPSLTFIGHTDSRIEHIEALKNLIKNLLISWYRNGHRMILTGTRPGFERLVMECAAELIENYECQGYHITLLNCNPKLRTCIQRKPYIHFLDFYLPADDTETLQEFLIASTSLLFLYSDPKAPDALADGLRWSAAGTAIPVYNMFRLLEDKVLF